MDEEKEEVGVETPETSLLATWVRIRIFTCSLGKRDGTGCAYSQTSCPAIDADGKGDVPGEDVILDRSRSRENRVAIAEAPSTSAYSDASIEELVAMDSIARHLYIGIAAIVDTKIID